MASPAARRAASSRARAAAASAARARMPGTVPKSKDQVAIRPRGVGAVVTAQKARGVGEALAGGPADCGHQRQALGAGERGRPPPVPRRPPARPVCCPRRAANRSRGGSGCRSSASGTPAEVSAVTPVRDSSARAASLTARSARGHLLVLPLHLGAGPLDVQRGGGAGLESVVGQLVVQPDRFQVLAGGLRPGPGWRPAGSTSGPPRLRWPARLPSVPARLPPRRRAAEVRVNLARSTSGTVTVDGGVALVRGQHLEPAELDLVLVAGVSGARRHTGQVARPSPRRPGRRRLAVCAGFPVGGILAARARGRIPLAAAWRRRGRRRPEPRSRSGGRPHA